MPMLPFETVDTIIDLLANDPEGYSTLKAGALVSDSFRLLCWKRIFRHISLGCDSEGYRPSKMLALISRWPEVADYARSLAIYVSDSQDLPEVLLQLANIESLTIASLDLDDDSGLPGKFGKWEYIPLPLRNAIVDHLFRLPTLTQLSITDILGVPSTYLTACVNIKTLEMTRSTIRGIGYIIGVALPGDLLCPQDLRSDDPTVLLDLLLVRRPDQRPLADPSAIQKLSVTWKKSEGVLSTASICKIATELKELNIRMHNKSSITEFGSIAQFPRSLQHLTLSFGLSIKPADSFVGLCPELEKIKFQNALTILVVDIFMGGSTVVHKGGWGRLEDAIMGGNPREEWPALRLVELNIHYIQRMHRLETKLRKIRELCFQRFMSSDFIEFRFILHFPGGRSNLLV